MKKFAKYFLSALLILSLLATATGCYMVSAQKMNTVKGTYKLTAYTYIPSYERKEGYTPKVYNYIEDETYQYEDYLIVTGSSTGYYVHKDANTPAYAKEVTLSYEYDPEDSKKIQYITYNDAISINETSGIHKLGVTKNSLNYSKAGFDYTELFTKRPMRSEDITVRWEKVKNATDLSYVESQLGEIKKYDYQAFGTRGIYELGYPIEIESGNVLDHAYQYFFYVIDTATGATTATAYYASKDAPTEGQVRQVSLSKDGADWNAFFLDQVLWSKDLWGNCYYNENDGQRNTLTRASNDISDAAIQSLIDDRMPFSME